MLKLIIPEMESWDEKNECFISSKAQTIMLEHSLVSVSKWEQKWHKPFLTNDSKTAEETIDYIKCMTVTPNVSDDTYEIISSIPSLISKIKAYIEDPMTATTINDYDQKKSSREIITSELIYYWMIALTIPYECRTWHLNTLLTLIQVCNIKNEGPKKMSKGDVYKRNAALNAARRKKFNTNV